MSGQYILQFIGCEYLSMPPWKHSELSKFFDDILFLSFFLFLNIRKEIPENTGKCRLLAKVKNGVCEVKVKVENERWNIRWENTNATMMDATTPSPFCYKCLMNTLSLFI